MDHGGSDQDGVCPPQADSDTARGGAAPIVLRSTPAADQQNRSDPSAAWVHARMTKEPQAAV